MLKSIERQLPQSNDFFAKLGSMGDLAILKVSAEQEQKTPELGALDNIYRLEIMVSGERI
jgi:hypothetical protein